MGCNPLLPRVQRTINCFYRVPDSSGSAYVLSFKIYFLRTVLAISSTAYALKNTPSTAYKKGGYTLKYDHLKHFVYNFHWIILNNMDLYGLY